MSYCIKCGHLAKENERFCTVCGTPLIASKNKDLARTVTVTRRKKVLSIPEENSAFAENDCRAAYGHRNTGHFALFLSGHL